METTLTWQDAKSKTLARAVEIAALVPAGEVASVSESEKGTLMSCGETQYNWNGWVRVELTDGSNVASAIEALVPKLESHFVDTGFAVTRGKTILDTLRIKVGQPGSAELYLIDEFDPHTINIAAGSDCFALPEDVYPGGDF
ncbi:hypothetical protein [Leucobacter sp. 1207-22]|uniref:hypothetical protein n=1 Tax=Leucobacter sp. 1207-22 TaxID=2604456 RepID=UPI004064B62A